MHTSTTYSIQRQKAWKFLKERGKKWTKCNNVQHRMKFSFRCLTCWLFVWLSQGQIFVYQHQSSWAFYVVDSIERSSIYNRAKKKSILKIDVNNYLPATLKPERWSTAFFASKISSYTTNAVPFVSVAVPLCRRLKYE